MQKTQEQQKKVLEVADTRKNNAVYDSKDSKVRINEKSILSPCEPVVQRH